MKNKIKQNNSDAKNFLTRMKKIILSLLISIISLLAGSQIVLADSSVLSALPLSASSTIDTSFDITVQINPANNNVCVVKGTINLNNLSCQKITLTSGLLTQTVPTCEAPNFTIGIPKCATTSQNLFVISVKGIQSGQASSSFSGVKIIGEGKDIANSLQNGAYNIVDVVQITTATTTATSTISEEVSAEISSTTGIQIPSGVGELNPINNNEGKVSSTTSTSSVATTTETNGLVATAFEAFANIPNKPIVALVLVALVSAAGLFFFRGSGMNIPKPPTTPNLTGGF